METIGTKADDQAPAPIPVSVDRAAELFDVTEKTVRTWIRAGLPVLKKGGKGRGNAALLDLAELIPWYLEENALDVAKTRLASAQAEKYEMENAVRRGALANMKDVERFWGDAVTACRSRLLAMPSKLAPQLINNDNSSAIANLIRLELYAALAELSCVDVGCAVQESADDN